MPPSDSAIFRSGNFRSTGDHTRSAAACTMFIGVSVIRQSIGASGAVITSWRRRADVQAHDDLLVAARLPERVPVVGVEARPAELRRVLREGDRVGALARRCGAPRRRAPRVPDRRQRARDEAARMGAAPLVDVPVVVGLHHRQRDVLVLGAGEQLAAELRERREAQRAEHAVGVHVLHPLVDVVAAGPHLVERRRLHAVLLRRPAGDRVERDVGDLLALVEPDVGAVVTGDELRRQVDVLGGQAALEEVRRLDHVVVDAHQHHVSDVHPPDPPIAVCCAAHRTTGTKRASVRFLVRSTSIARVCGRGAES